MAKPGNLKCSMLQTTGFAIFDIRDSIRQRVAPYSLVNGHRYLLCCSNSSTLGTYICRSDDECSTRRRQLRHQRQQYAMTPSATPSHLHLPRRPDSGTGRAGRRVPVRTPPPASAPSPSCSRSTTARTPPPTASVTVDLQGATVSQVIASQGTYRSGEWFLGELETSGYRQALGQTAGPTLTLITDRPRGYRHHRHHHQHPGLQGVHRQQRRRPRATPPKRLAKPTPPTAAVGTPPSTTTTRAPTTPPP